MTAKTITPEIRVTLPCGRIAIFDEADLHLLTGWRLTSHRGKNTYYVRARVPGSQWIARSEDGRVGSELTKGVKNRPAIASKGVAPISVFSFQRSLSCCVSVPTKTKTL